MYTLKNIIYGCASLYTDAVNNGKGKRVHNEL